MTDIEKRHIEQLQRAAEIAKVDLDSMSPGEFLRLQGDLHEFISSSGVGQRTPLGKLTDAELENWELLPKVYVKEIVEYLRKRLSALATTNGAFIIPEPFLNIEIEGWVDDKSQPFKLRWRAEPPQAGKLAFFLHFAGSRLPAERFLPCPNCGHIFVLASYARKDHDHFCSRRCSRHMGTRIYRARAAYREGKELAEIAVQMNLNGEFLKSKLAAEIREREARKVKPKRKPEWRAKHRPRKTA